MKIHPQHHKLYYKFYTALLPIHHYTIGRVAAKYLEELEKTQWWSQTQIKELQNKKLRALVQHAYRKVPYYHQKFRELNLLPDDIRTTNDLVKLPFLSKEDIQNNIPNKLIISNDFNQRKVEEVRTGGSTGKPLRFFCDKKQLEYRWASTNRNMRWTGYEIGDKLVRLWSSVFDITQSHKFKQRLDTSLLRRRFLPAFEMTEETLRSYAEDLKKFKPMLLEGYAEALYFFAKFLQKEGINDVRPHAILSSAQTLFEYQREVIEDVFECDVFNRYGTREFSGIAHECEEHSGLHINAENMIVEVVKDGELVSSGELGEILITDLNNYVVPFIRYKIGDVARLTDEVCSCGRGLPLLENVEGRLQAIIKGTNKRYIPGTFFPHLFKEFDGIKEFQIIQIADDNLVLKIVKGGAYTKKELDEVINKMHEYAGEDMKIDIEFVERIPIRDSGKRQHTISKIPINFL